MVNDNYPEGPFNCLLKFPPPEESQLLGGKPVGYLQSLANNSWDHRGQIHSVLRVED